MNFALYTSALKTQGIFIRKPAGRYKKQTGQLL